MNTTNTTKGIIPHLRIVTAEGVIFAPVLLETEETLSVRGGRHLVLKGGNDYRLPVPVEVGGEYAYALPGGGAITASELHGQLQEAA